MKQYTSRIVISLTLISIIILLIFTPNNSVFAKYDDTKITLIGEGCVDVKADSAEIYGSIEYADTNKEIADTIVTDIVDKIKAYINNLNNTDIEVTFKSVYPINEACYRNSAFMGYANFQILVTDLNILPEIYNNIITFDNVKVDGIQYSANNTNGYVDAIKQAIAKANSKISILYSTEASIIEIEEQDVWNSESVYISSYNINFDTIPLIQLCAKIEVTYSLK